MSRRDLLVREIIRRDREIWRRRLFRTAVPPECLQAGLTAVRARRDEEEAASACNGRLVRGLVVLRDVVGDRAKSDCCSGAMVAGAEKEAAVDISP